MPSVEGAGRIRQASACVDGAPRAKSIRSSLDVSIADEGGRPVRVSGLAAWLARVAPRDARGAVTIALLKDSRVRALNRRYRGIDRPTDVLSFPTGRGRLHSRSRAGPWLPHVLGDIAIATGVAARQARAAGHPVSTEYRILALHGLLHLLGYDHHCDDGRMARLERTLRRRGGLERGLIERART